MIRKAPADSCGSNPCTSQHLRRAYSNLGHIPGMRTGAVGACVQQKCNPLSQAKPRQMHERLYKRCVIFLTNQIVFALDSHN